MKQQLLGFLKLFVPFSIVLFIIQFLVINFVLEDIDFYYSTWAIYSFHILATFIIYLVLVLIHKNFRDNTGFAFMGGSLLKMLAAVLFLLPMMLKNQDYRFINLLSFFIPYFLYLIFETIYAVRLINSK
jgi:hypothetical protein